MDSLKIPLPKFLKLLTSNNVPVPKAMAVSGKIYKDFNTPEKLAQLTEVKLIAAGVNDKEDRRCIIAAVRRAGYVPLKRKLEKVPEQSLLQPVAGPSTLSAVQAAPTPPKTKRRRVDTKNEFLPDGPPDEAAEYGSLDFNEVLDEQVLKAKAAVVNRAPLMTAWATIVAERMGFGREEALSIASAYTEMNAISKGISLGLFKEGKRKGMEAVKGASQPYVELMGRRVPLYQTQSMRWRALSNGTPVQPGAAFSYVSRAFRQTTPYVVGALRLLAESYPVNEITTKAWGLYTEFRPQVDGWGKRSEVKCEMILALRKSVAEGETSALGLGDVVKVENADGEQTYAEPMQTKVRGLTLEEYEAALDQDDTFNEVDLGVITPKRETDQGA